VAAFCPNLGSLRTISRVSALVFVRTWSDFGQFYEFVSVFCPNLGSLRTISRASGCVLSKLGITSDNFSWILTCYVRTWDHFKQYHESLTSFCPNKQKKRPIKDRFSNYTSMIIGKIIGLLPVLLYRNGFTTSMTAFLMLDQSLVPPASSVTILSVISSSTFFIRSPDSLT
jgi:hypothetical protein